MGGRSDVIEKIKEKIQNLFKHDAQNYKWKYVIEVLIISVLLIFVSNMMQLSIQNQFEIEEDQEVASNQEEEEDSFVDDVEEMEVHYEKTLQEMLNEISGVLEVDIMINIDSTNVQVYEKDLITGTQTTDELDKNGG